MRFACLVCESPAETTDVQEAAAWLAGTLALPCGHAEADFLPHAPVPVMAVRHPPRRLDTAG